ncbi:hypothetical protein [Pueribacillus sp. YX66]|uniref:hypothetical protein n=1 Tax=Pueribacillus sp. YX66 TaxID=3229242 RepID=UPI00358D8429
MDMRKFYVVIIFASLLFVIGCSNKAYEEVMQQGYDAIENEEYIEAEACFKRALDEKKDDNKAITLLKQTQSFQLALLKFNKGNLEAANDAVVKVTEIEDGSERLVERASVLKEDIDKFKDSIKMYEETYQTAKDQFDNEKYHDTIKVIEEVLKQDLSHPAFTGVKHKFESLLKTAKENVEVKAVEQKERKVAKKVKKERKKSEEKLKEQGIGDAEGYWLSTDKSEACHITNTYWACAVAFSDVMFHYEFTNIEHVSSSEIKVTMSGYSTTLQMKGKDTLSFEDVTYHRVSKKQANDIYDGYYTLP